MKQPNRLTGQEMTMLAQDELARAIYLRARATMDAAEKLPPAEHAAEVGQRPTKVLAPTLRMPCRQRHNVHPADGRVGEGKVTRRPRPSRTPKAAAAVPKRSPYSRPAWRNWPRLWTRPASRSSSPGSGSGYNGVKLAAEGADLLDLMIKAGGTIEDNLPVAGTAAAANWP